MKKNQDDAKIAEEVSQGNDVPQKGKTQQKFRFRSKQDKIQSVYDKLEKKYSNLGVLAEDKEIVRGQCCLRMHVKTFRGLQVIPKVLKEIDRNWPIARIAVVFSTKNPKQKKGFIIYFRLGSVQERIETENFLKENHGEVLTQIKVAVKNPAIQAKYDSLEQGEGDVEEDQELDDKSEDSFGELQFPEPSFIERKASVASAG